MDKVWTDEAWEQYVWWQNQDKKTLRKLNAVIADIDRNGYGGIGHPEPLSGNLAGLWSRKIDDKNRIVYAIANERVKIYQCKGHYSDR